MNRLLAILQPTTVDPLQESARTRAIKSVAAALGMICAAVAAFLIAAYISRVSNAGIPLAHWFLCALLSMAGLFLLGVSLRGREIAGLAVPVFGAAVAALPFGIVGVFCVLLAGFGLDHLVTRWRSRRSPKIDDPEKIR